MASTEQVTDEQAGQALQQLLDEKSSEEKPAEQQSTQTASPQITMEEEAEQTETPAGEQQQEEVAEDDLESLKARLADLESRTETEKQSYQSQLEALNKRHRENERILTDRHLRKSNAVDKALKAMKATRTEGGVSEEDYDRVIRQLEETMNPQSAQFSEPTVSQQPVPTDDQALTMNNFLNEKAMTDEQANEFGQFIRTEASNVMSEAELAVANQSLDGFLRLAHRSWVDSQSAKDKKAKQDDAVGAVKAVQRTQRQAARAASSTSAAPKKQPSAPRNEVDVNKLTKDDVANLLKQATQQYLG